MSVGCNPIRTGLLDVASKGATNPVLSRRNQMKKSEILDDSMSCRPSGSVRWLMAFCLMLFAWQPAQTHHQRSSGSGRQVVRRFIRDLAGPHRGEATGAQSLGDIAFRSAGGEKVDFLPGGERGQASSPSLRGRRVPGYGREGVLILHARAID